MADKQGLRVEEPKAIWNKTVTVDSKGLFKALAKVAVGLKTGRWDVVLKEGLNILDAVGLEKDSPSQLAWRLVHNALLRALKELVEDNYDLLQTDPENVNNVGEKIEIPFKHSEVRLGSDFFEKPGKLKVLDAVKEAFDEWLKVYGANEAQARAITSRLNSYFVFALNEEWREHAQTYEPLKEALHTPFAQASEREQGWLRYKAWLQKQVDERMFDEAFGLRQVYIQPRAYYERKIKGEPDELGGGREYGERARERLVVRLEEALDEWLNRADRNDAIRVISGGPGSGKSSFTKMFAAKHAAENAIPILFVPLHHFELGDDLVDAVGRFVQDDPYLTQNPLSAMQDGEKTFYNI